MPTPILDFPNGRTSGKGIVGGMNYFGLTDVRVSGATSIQRRVSSSVSSGGECKQFKTQYKIKFTFQTCRTHNFMHKKATETLKNHLFSF